jgi:hypothetical protein
VQTIKIEKVYGDFKRLHAHIIETFQNELKEYERFRKMQRKSGRPSQGVSNQMSASVKSEFSSSTHTGRAEGMEIDLSHPIAIEEFSKYGQIYHDEAKRILTHMPRLPSKYNDMQNSRLTAEQLMDDLEIYLNNLIKCSPLITNLFYVRDFFTNP